MTPGHGVRPDAPLGRRGGRGQGRRPGACPRAAWARSSDALPAGGRVVRRRDPRERPRRARCTIEDGRAARRRAGRAARRSRADLVVTTCHPQITFLRPDRPRIELPDDFVHDIENWKTRSGTVKINLALDRLPEFTADPGFDPDVHGGAIMHPRRRRLPRDGVPGGAVPAGRPRCRSPTPRSRRCSTARSRPRAST